MGPADGAHFWEEVQTGGLGDLRQHDAPQRSGILQGGRLPRSSLPNSCQNTSRQLLQGKLQLIAQPVIFWLHLDPKLGRNFGLTEHSAS